MSPSEASEPNLTDIWADVDMIRRVLINLLENMVLKYTPPDQQDSPSGAEQQDKMVMIWVKDDGAWNTGARQGANF